MTEPYDRAHWDREGESSDSADLENARENVFDGWPSSEDVSAFVARAATTGPEPPAADEPRRMPFSTALEPEEDEAEERQEPEEAAVGALADGTVDDEDAAPEEPVESQPEPEPEPEPVALLDPAQASQEHAPGDLEVPPGYGVLEGVPDGSRRAVGIVVSRFNGEVTSRLLASALAELEHAGVSESAVTVMPVPGAFELPIGAMALARTRRFACIIALGCVIRGDTPHFDYVASEAASGLQLAALETGVPVSFGVLTLERADQAEARVGKGAEAARTALEMADLFSHLRAAAAR